MHNHKTTTQGLHQNHGIEPNALPEYLFHRICTDRILYEDQWGDHQ